MFRKFVLFNLFLAFCVIVLGAYVRLSEAGLGCPDWPGCYGKLTVPQTAEEIAKANEAFPDQPLEMGKAWKEMSHRYLAGCLGLSIFILAISSCFRKQNRSASVKLSFLLLGLVVFQSALGMWTVIYKVIPLSVVAHLMTGLLTLYLLFWLYLRTAPDIQNISNRAGLKWFCRIALLVLFVQIALGGWTSSNYAALACPDFPTCLGKWWINADYKNAFTLWHGTDINYQGGILKFSERAAIHWIHRLGALITFVILSLLVVKTTGHPQEKALSKGGVILSILLFVQIGLGIGNVVFKLPIFVAVAHNGVAALLILTLAYIRFFTTSGVVVARETLAQTNVLSGQSGFPGPPEGLVTPEGFVVPVAEPEIPLQVPPESLIDRLRSQLKRTRSGLAHVVVNLPLGKQAIDEEVLEEIESNLLMADVGIEATTEIINNLSESAKRHQLNETKDLKTVLCDQLLTILEPCSNPLKIPEQAQPFVILVIGVNGVGKTTTIGKLAKRLQQQGHSVLLAAGDTFRAAAIEQLQIWGERNGIQVVAQHTGADSASVIYDALQSASSKGVDVLIADTAGRLHTKANLMEELKKVKRILGKLDETAPQEILLVLDAGTGQNTLNQTRQFNEALGVTGLVLTKLDGTAKGGVIFALAKQFGLPIRFIGVGEGVEDLQDFDATAFIDALFEDESRAI